VGRVAQKRFDDVGTGFDRRRVNRRARQEVDTMRGGDYTGPAAPDTPLSSHDEDQHEPHQQKEQAGKSVEQPDDFVIRG
jgi:hypothetical protein